VKALRDRTGAGMMDCKKALNDADGDMERAIDLLRERGISKADKKVGRDASEGRVGIALDGGHGVIVEIACETDFAAKNDKFQALVQQVADTLLAAEVSEGVDVALATKMGEGTIDSELKAAVSVIGENIQLRRVDAVQVEGVVGGYVHTTGKLGVLVGIRGSSPASLSVAAKDIAMHVTAADPAPIAVDRDGVDPAVIEKEQTILRNQALESGKPEKIVENIVKGRLNKFYAERCLVEQAFVKDPDRKVGDIVKEAGGDGISGFTKFVLGETTG
jgi:elongation factor Ts